MIKYFYDKIDERESDIVTGAFNHVALQKTKVPSGSHVQDSPSLLRDRINSFSEGTVYSTAGVLVPIRLAAG